MIILPFYLDPKASGSKKKKLALRRSGSRDLDDALNEIHSGGKSKTSKSKKALKKLRSRQSSESADEKDVHAKQQRKLGRTKSRDTGGSNNSLDTITESPKAGAKVKNKDENADDSFVMKQRSTKRWRLFSVSKPRRSSPEKDESLDKESAETKDDAKKREIEKKKETRRSKKEAKKGAKEEHAKKESEKKENAKKNEAEKAENAAEADKHEIEKKGELVRSKKGSKKGALENAKKETKKGGENQTTTTHAQPNARTGVPRGSVVKETVARTNLRQLNSQDDVANTIRSARSSLRKPSEQRAQAAEPRGFKRSTSSNAAVSSKGASEAITTQLKRANSEVRRRDGLFSSFRRPKHDKGAVENKEVVPRNEGEPTAKEVMNTPQQVGKRESKRSKLETMKSKGSVSVFDDMKRYLFEF